MSCPAHIARGESIRAWMLEQARYCHAHGVLFPTKQELSDIIGICTVQVWRHFAALVRSGAVEITRVRHARIRIEAVQ